MQTNRFTKCMLQLARMCFYRAAFAFACVHFSISSLSASWHFLQTDVTFLMREEATRGNSANKSGEAWVIFCDAFPTEPPTVPHMPRQLHLWLMTSLIVGLRAYDLLIKLVFTLRELVGCMVTKCTCAAPNQTAQTEILGLCTPEVDIVAHIDILLCSSLLEFLF